jgi:dolichol-phosphate mannosyltransferase
MDTLYIVMPAYNEAENIEDVISQWHPIAEQINAEGNICKIIVANDGSKDNTWDILNNLKEKYACLEPLNKQNSGHGATILFLYRYAIEKGATYIFQTDSDGQTNPDEFWVMWKNRDKYDFQIGTRYGRQDGLSRIIVTKTLRIVVWIMFHVWVKDANTPFRLMNSQHLSEILAKIPENFFLANVAISAIAVKRNERIAWYPITFRPRQGGVNSINLKRIFKIGLQAIGDFKRINKNLKD